MSRIDADGPVEPAAPRTVVHGDGVAWVAAGGVPPGAAMVTSLPDVSGIPEFDFETWRAWFIETIRSMCASVTDDAVAVFYQSDIKLDGRYVDKAHLVHLGAAAAGSHCLWHKIVCRTPAGRTTFGRPAYTHMLCFSRTLRLTADDSSPDVLPGQGTMTWPQAMGTDACHAVCRFLLRSTTCRVVVDPFCGRGTMLAVANAYGMPAIGVERSAKRVRKARALTFEGGDTGDPDEC